MVAGVWHHTRLKESRQQPSLLTKLLGGWKSISTTLIGKQRQHKEVIHGTDSIFTAVAIAMLIVLTNSIIDKY